MTKLRLASYNVHKCVGTDGRRAPGRVVDVVNGLDADVVALQEVDRRLGQRPAALPRRMIEAHSDFVAVEAGRGPSLGWHGNTVLLRRGVEARAVRELDLPGLEPRGALMVEAESAAGKFRVVAVHLGLRRRDRVRQLGAIRHAVAARAAMPTTILGDFNEWSLARGLEALGEGYDVLAPGRSFHTLHPMGHLDRIALGASVGLRDAGVHDNRLARRASDHLPVWADVALAG